VAVVAGQTAAHVGRPTGTTDPPPPTHTHTHTYAQDGLGRMRGKASEVTQSFARGLGGVFRGTPLAERFVKVCVRECPRHWHNAGIMAPRLT
jgi:hypothetical protein